jgi:hypothetical protein
MMPKINLLKMPDPAAQTAKYVNMMNVAKQQEAAERQAAMAQETLTLQKEKGAREAALQVPALAKAKTEAEVAQLDYVMNFFKATANDLANSTTPEQAVARGERLKQQFPDPALQKRIDETITDLVSDPSQFEAKRKTIILRTLDAKDQFAVTHSDIFDAEGNLYNKETSPTGSFPTRITPGVVTGPADTGAPPAVAPRTPVAPAPAAAPSGPVPTGKFGATQVVPEASVPLTPYQQDHIRQMQEGLGMSNTPASFSPGASAGQMTPQRAQQIVDAAVNTRVMAQEDFDQLIAMTPEQNKQPFMDMIRSSNIKLQPGGMGQQPQFAVNQGQRPQADFAVNRGATPAATLAQYQVGQQIKGRNQNIPPSANVAPQVLGNQKAAETAGSENVKVGTEPRIVAGTERAKRLEKLRGEMPIAQAETQTLVTNLTGRINAIDEYLRSGSRNSIIGAVEGRIPRLFQSETRSDAQGVYDYITSNTVLQKLIDDRGQTETGGSPQGVVSDADLKVAAQASTKLTQTGSERKQEIEMQRLRDELYRTREQAIQKYNNVYREVMKEAPELRLKVRTVAPKYKSAPQTPTRAKSLQNIFGG